MRQKAVVTYGYNDISLVGEYNGKAHNYGNMVYFKGEDGKQFCWNTLLPPTRVSQVELHTNEKVKISYTYAGVDDHNRTWIKNVRFLRTIEKLD